MKTVIPFYISCPLEKRYMHRHDYLSLSMLHPRFTNFIFILLSPSLLSIFRAFAMACHSSTYSVHESTPRPHVPHCNNIPYPLRFPSPPTLDSAFYTLQTLFYTHSTVIVVPFVKWNRKGFAYLFCSWTSVFPRAGVLLWVHSLRRRSHPRDPFSSSNSACNIAMYSSLVLDLVPQTA